MTPSELTFASVDDLLAAHSRGRLVASQQAIEFVPAALGPLIELAVYQSKGGCGPLFDTDWISAQGQRPMRDALAGADREWFGELRNQGFLRTVFNPLDDANTPVRTRFLMAARRAAEEMSSLSVATSQSLAAALREMESNVYEHSNHSTSGVMAYHAQPGSFEFVVADAGEGVLATLKQAPEYRDLTDHGTALRITLHPGASRYGTAANRGMGFKDLFVGLADLNANLRFRSGDHALTISGTRPDLKSAQLAQKAFFQGFLVSVRCNAPAGPNGLR